MLNPCCPASSEVTVIDTPDHTVLIVDGVQTLLPKYENCAGAPLPGGSQLATCADLAAKQDDIQVQDDGVSVGAPGAATVYNFGAGLTSTLVGNVLTISAANTDTDVSALTMTGQHQPDQSFRITTLVTEDAVVVQDFEDIPVWTETTTGIVEKIDITEASQDNNLMAGNGVTSATVVGVNGLDDQRGMTDRKTYAHVKNNWVITNSRSYRVGVDARWPTVGSVFNYLADRRFQAGTQQFIILPSGVTDASAGLGPMHPQHDQIYITGTAATGPLPARTALAMTGISGAAMAADFAANALALEAILPSILILPAGTTTISNGHAGYGSLENLTIRGNLRYTSDDAADYSIRNVAIEGSLTVEAGRLGTQNLYVISSDTSRYRLFLDGISAYVGLGVQYFQGGVGNIVIAANSSAQFVGATITARSATQNNIAVLTSANASFETVDAVFSDSGDANMTIKGGSDVVHFGDAASSISMRRADLTPGGFSANLYASDGSTFGFDINNSFTMITLDTATRGVFASRGAIVNFQRATFLNHINSHIEASQTDVSLETVVSGVSVATMDATPTNSIVATNGSRVKIGGVVLGQPSIPAVGTQGPTFAHIVV